MPQEPQFILNDNGEQVATVVDLGKYLSPRQMQYAMVMQQLMVCYHKAASAGKEELFSDLKVSPDGTWLDILNRLVFRYLLNWRRMRGEPADHAWQVARHCPLLARWTQLGLIAVGIRCRVVAGTASWYIRSSRWQDDGGPTHYTYQYDQKEAFAAAVAGVLPEIHCWVEVLPAWCHIGRGQVIDLSVQFLKETMEYSGAPVPYQRDRVPANWKYLDEKGYGMDLDRYEKDPDATRFVHRCLVEATSDWQFAVCDLQFQAAVAEAAHGHLVSIGRI